MRTNSFMSAVFAFGHYAMSAVLVLGLAAAAPAISQDKPQGKPQDQKAAGSKDDTKTGTKRVDTPIIVLVPFAYGTDEKLANGCWARLYTDEDFRGEVLSLVGPVDVANARVGGFDWGRRFESVVVGPAATLVVYDNENFRQRTATFKSGQRVRALEERMGFFEDIRSLRIACR